MAVFDRDAALERRQILEISANVARRLLDVLDHSRNASPSLKAEIDETIVVITGIQRDVDHIVNGLPAYEALDVAILTHILGGQQHALERLEGLEAKLKAPHAAPILFDPARTHAALIATAREIEREALRFGGPDPVASPPAAFATPLAPPMYPAPPPRPVTPMPPRVRPDSTSSAPPRKPVAAARSTLPDLSFLIATPLSRTALVVSGIVALAFASWMMVPAPPRPAAPVAQERSPEFAVAQRPVKQTAAMQAGIAPSGIRASVEQPYLVVLATRRSTEELQQDYRSFKQTYAELLTSSKARVDRIQGQDRQTYYRLSLIPPQSRDEAKTLCSRLRLAGLSGCWIRQVPVN